MTQRMTQRATAQAMNDDPLRWEPYDRHWIRLRGPWTVSWLAPADVDAQPGRVTLPASWEELFGDRRGTARFERRFQRPTNLDSDERVVITLCEVRCAVLARLNDHELTPLVEPLGDPESTPCEQSLSFDVTALLQTSNRLTLDLSVADPPSSETPCGLWRPVLLEVIALD